MTVKTQKKQNPDMSTARHLPFSQIKENIIFMKDDSARVIMKCSTINFLLKNSDEQDSIIVSFQRFLNSLHFPIQILVRSTKLDIDGYLWKLNDKAIKQKNPLLQNQTYEYIEYLKKLIEVAQIMKKEFYIIIPYDQVENTSVKDTSILWPVKSFFSSVFDNSVSTLKIRSQNRNFTKVKKGLLSRSNTVKTWLENIWIRWEILEKSELVKFLTDYYNPSLNNFAKIQKDIWEYDFVA